MRIKLYGNMSAFIFTLLCRPGRCVLMAGFLMIVCSSLHAQITDNLNTPGAGTWTVPAGVTEIVVEAWGGGGCGGNTTAQGGKGGGGGGAYSRSRLPVTPGQSIPYVVGSGCVNLNLQWDPNPDGEDSWFLNTGTLLAKGGLSVTTSANFGQPGGNAAEGAGNEVKFSGGGGANRGLTGTNRDGGGGGSAAGSAAAGVGAVNYVGAVAPAGGGNGGSSKPGTHAGTDPGEPGGFPGGGGGGGFTQFTSPTNVLGGNGGNGLIRITYTAAAPAEIDLVSITPASLCPGIASSPVVTFTPSGFSGAQTFTVELSNASGSFTSPVVIGSGSSSPLAAAIPGGALAAGGNYRVRVINGSVTSNDLAISLLAPPAITVGANPSVCMGATGASLSYSGATGSPNEYSISWSTAAITAGFVNVTNATLSSSPVSIAVPGAAAPAAYTATLTVRNSTTGCVSNSYNISVTVNPLPTITLGNNNPSLCVGLPSIALSYSATTGSPNQYSIAWNTAAITAGFANLTDEFLWGSPLSIAVPGSAAPNTYTGTMTVRNSTTGCVSNNYNLNVAVNGIPAITPGTNPIVCAGTTSASLPYSNPVSSPDRYDIAWGGVATAAGFTNVSGATLPSSPISITVPAGAAANTYTGILIVRNSTTGCFSGNYNISVTVNALPGITVGTNPTVCAGVTTASLPYSGATGSPNQYNIAWSTAATTAGFTNVTNATLPSGAVSIAVPGAAAPATYTGTLVVRSMTGCVSGNYNISVTVNALPGITAGTNPSVCAGVTGALLPYSSTTGSPNQYSIAWSTAATTAGFTNVTNVTLPASPVSITVPGAAAPAVYTGALTVRNGSTGCVSSPANISVTLLSRPVATIATTGPVSICTGDDTLLTANSGSGYSYEWKNDQGAVGSGIGYTANATGNYYVVVTGSNNCKDSSATVPVTVHSVPQISITPGDTSFCAGGIVTLNAISPDTGLSYLWKKEGIPLSATADFIEISETGSYYVVAGQAGTAGCTDSSDTVHVVVYPLPSVSINRNGDTLHTDDGYISYQWLTGGQPVPGATNAVFSPLSDGAYSVEVTDTNGCMNVSSVETVVVGVAGVTRQSVRIYPNPVERLLYIESADFVRVGIYNMEGRLLSRYEGMNLAVDVSGLPEGIYIISLVDKTGSFIRKESFIRHGR